MPAASLREPPADSSAIVKQTPAPSGEPIRAAAGQRYDQVWLRALILSPSARHFMTTTRLGATDMRTLTAQFIKPASSVVMGFSADPHLGMTADNFSGSAVVFLATATFSGNRTASLR
jgi:hypothetical protein